MIRILHMIGSLNIGGSQTMVLNLYRNINREKIQFDFIIDKPNELYFADEIIALGGKIFTFPGFTGKNVSTIRKKWDSFFIEHPEYSILHTHIRSYASVYIPIAKKHGLRVISHSHSTSNGTGISSIVKAILQYPLRFQADYFFACSEQAGRWLFGKSIVTNPKFCVIKNSIDPDKYKYNENLRNRYRELLGVGDCFLIGHVGRFDKPKNHIFLIDVFYEYAKKHDNAKLLLIGDGILKNQIVEKVKSLNLQDKVIMTGGVKNPYDYYSAMDYFVFPSLWEGLGMAVIEAQANGLNCMVSDTVPSEADLKCGLVRYKSLSENPQIWASEILLSQENKRITPLCELRKSGYDAIENAKKLEKTYLDIIEEMKC